MSTPRKTRSDKKIGTIEKELGISIYGPNGRKVRKDKPAPADRVGQVRKDALTDDQKIAAKRQVKVHPKIKTADLNKVRQAVKNVSQK